MYAKLLTNLVTLNILKALKSLKDLNAYNLAPLEKYNKSIKLNNTIIKSNRFIKSLEYRETPFVNIFNNYSIANNIVKNLFNSSNVRVSSIKPSKPKTIVLAKTKIFIKYSNPFVLTIKLNLYLISFIIPNIPLMYIK